MIVSKLERNKVHFGDRLVFDINSEILSIFKLEEGLDLPLPLYEKLLYESCLLKSYKLLARQDYTRYLIKRKLDYIYNNNFIVEKVLDSLVEKSYINDYDYAKNFIKNKNFGRKRMEYELKTRGINSEIIENIYIEISKDEKVEIKKLLKKVERKDFKKKVEFFLRRGYSLDDILDILENRR